MNLPINGRIAIIDDQLIHAEPLMKVLSRKQMPYTYFSGEVNYLPIEGENLNDVRVLFLDINLIDNSEHENIVLKGKLIPVISRVISEFNYPYIIVYWSRHEHHKNLLEVEIFNEELTNRKPIGYLSANKSDFFDLFGAETEDFEEKIIDLFDKINNLFSVFPAYSYLLQWENNVHLSTDRALQEIFSSFQKPKDWSNNANYILNKLGNAFLGKHYEDSLPEDKIRASFISLNSILKDTLESLIYNTQILNAQKIESSNDEVVINITTINEKLNISRTVNNLLESGNVIVFEELDSLFKKLLNKVLPFFKLKSILKQKNSSIEESVLKKLTEVEHNKIKKEIKDNWEKIGIIVTPICDFVQKENKVHDRVVKGLLIPISYRDFIDDKSEAVYILPISINHKNIEYLIVLDFRYFFTCDLEVEKVSGLFRIRQELLSEIQSKLSRHISRQGILAIN